MTHKINQRQDQAFKEFNSSDRRRLFCLITQSFSESFAKENVDGEYPHDTIHEEICVFFARDKEDAVAQVKHAAVSNEDNCDYYDYVDGYLHSFVHTFGDVTSASLFELTDEVKIDPKPLVQACEEFFAAKEEEEKKQERHKNYLRLKAEFENDSY